MSDKSSMITCPFAACLYFWHKWETRSGENKVGDDDRQSRAFIFSEWESGCAMRMIVVGTVGVRAKRDSTEVGEEVAGRNADRGNAVEKVPLGMYSNSSFSLFLRCHHRLPPVLCRCQTVFVVMTVGRTNSWTDQE